MFVKSVAKMVNKPLVNLLAKSLVNMLAEALVSMLAKTLANMSLHGKPYFLFPDALKRWSFLKNCAGRTWSFLYYRERWYFLFPKVWPYTLDGKWKMIFLKKIHRNIFSSGLLKRWSFQKGSCQHMIFLVLSGKMVFFPENMIFFHRAESERPPFPGNTWKHDAPPSEENQ